MVKFLRKERFPSYYKSFLTDRSFQTEVQVSARNERERLQIKVFLRKKHARRIFPILNHYKKFELQRESSCDALKTRPSKAYTEMY